MFVVDRSAVWREGGVENWREKKKGGGGASVGGQEREGEGEACVWAH